MEDIRGNLDRVREGIAAACRRAGRVADDVMLIAVSKTVQIERIRQGGGGGGDRPRREPGAGGAGKDRGRSAGPCPGT